MIRQGGNMLPYSRWMAPLLELSCAAPLSDPERILWRVEKMEVIGAFLSRRPMGL